MQKEKKVTMRRMLMTEGMLGDAAAVAAALISNTGNGSEDDHIFHTKC